MKSNLTIVTGASSNHFACLLNLLWSISVFEPTANVVVYDLGLTEDEAKQIPNIRKFDFSEYPNYFSMKANAGRMGFRPIAVQSAAKEFGGVVMWLDAGCLLTEPISEVIQYVKRVGVYCHRCSGIIATELHHNARQALGVTDDLLQLRLRDAGVCAFDTGNPKAKSLIDKWVSVALNKDITAPEGSSRKNHRQDAVFAVLLKQGGFDLDAYRTCAIRMRQDIMPLVLVKRLYAQFPITKRR
jgi:hypothetical protein